MLLVFGMDIEIRQPAVEGSATDTEQPRCQCSVTARTTERVEKPRLFIVQRITGYGAAEVRRRANLRRQVLGLDDRTATTNHGKFDGASELTHVSGPRMVHQQPHG